ncbi:MAG TPA: HPr(Ser) kinase/phosphatase [bacterium]|nr:HPr(Ser) kinase/phosphatase [bacterium]
MPSTTPVSVKQLIDTPDLSLTRENLDDQALEKREIKDNRVQVVGLSIAGFTDHLYRERVQLLGKSENDYLNTLGDAERSARIESFLACRPVAVIFTDPVRPSPEFSARADAHEVPLLSTRMVSSIFIDFIREHLNRLLAASATLHAQLLDVFGVGMLIMGESGVGKSETSLDLVMRGHKLIADDVVEIRFIPPDRLVGACNDMMRDLIEIRGIGLINVQRMFGVTSVNYEKQIDCIINLVLWDQSATFEYERIGATTRHYEILGVKRPYYIIPVRHGSNLSSLMEVIARDHMLRSQGVNVAAEFEQNLAKKLSEMGGA